jgi:trk system potassium uptake protein TrkH
MSRTFLFSRAWMQWCGGLGIVVFSLALLMGHESVSRRLFAVEGAAENIVSTVRTHARRVVVVYVAMTTIAILVLWAMQVDLSTAVVHVLAAVSTGGFSSYDASLAGLNSWPAAYLIIFVSFCGAVPLSLYYLAIARGWRLWFTDVEVHALVIAVLVTTALLAYFMHRGLPAMPLGEILRHAPLLGVSAQTTTGFTTLPISGLDPASKVVMILSMALGGTVGSTAGGIKILRLLILLRVLQLVLRRTAAPASAVDRPRLAGRRLDGDEIEKALLLFALFIIVILLSWIPFVAAGLNPLDALFEVVSAVGTVGLSTGITAPDLDPMLKGVLCLDMLFGRLEFIALLVVLYPSTWLGKRRDSQ